MITTNPHTSREISKQQPISQGILCHDEEGLQETSTNTLFSFLELRERFQFSVDRSMATYPIELPTAFMITYALPTPFKTLLPFVRGM